MSSQLLFTASSQKQFGDWGVGIENDPDTAAMGIENPNNYKNDLRNTIKVPANSEIAVVNCEVNRGVSFSLDLGDRFYWWYDELLETLNQNKVGCLPFPILMSEVLGDDEDDAAGELDIKALPGDRYAELIQEAMRRCICMPQFYRTATCVIDPLSSGAKLKFSITSHGNKASSNIDFGIPSYVTNPPVQSWLGLSQQNKSGVNWDLQWTATTNGKTGKVGGKVTRVAATSTFAGHGPAGDWDDVARVICRTAPLSVVGGVMIVDFENCPGGWEIGLSRPQTYATHSSSDEVTQFIGVQEDGAFAQCDYVVKYWQKGGAGKKVVQINQLIRGVPRDDLDQDNPEGYSAMVPVEYWGNTAGGRPLNQIDEDNMIDAGDEYVAIKFEVKGEGMEITLMDEVDGSGTNKLLMTTFTTTGLATQHVLPIGMNTWALYPLVSIPTQNDYLDFTQFSSDGNGTNWSDATNQTYNYPIDKNDRCNTELITGYADMDDGGRPWIPGSSFYGWAVSQADSRYGDDWGAAGYVGWMYEYLKTRNFYFNGMDGTAATYPCRYKLLDAQNEAPELCHGIITEKGDWGEEFFDTDGVYSTPEDFPPNMSSALGILYRNLFQTVDGVTSSIDATKTGNSFRGKWVVTASDDFGDEPDIMLIEVLPFNHQSYNLCRNVPSKMVYVVPKSDYRGRVTGKMFHEAHDRYYVSLNNPDDMYINQLEVRFTDKNGVTTSDLIGCSVVTFHIQPERLKGKDFGGG